MACIPLVLAACGESSTSPDGDTTPDSIASLTLSADRVTLNALGVTRQLSAVARDVDGDVLTGVAITWNSSQPDVVSVDGSGLITSRGVGEAEIVARARGLADTARVLVRQVLASVSVQPATVTLHAIGVIRALNARGLDPNNRTIPDLMFSWSSSDESVATVDTNGVVTTVGNGVAAITATTDTVSGSASFEVATVVFEEIDPALATPAAGYLWEMPVVIMRYFPTVDGVTFDATKTGDYSLGQAVRLAELKERTDRFDPWVKFALEEGSRFRGYKNADAQPSLGYRVVASITVYEPLPAGEVFKVVDGHPVYHPDFHQIFARFNMEDYVNNQGVREVWFWHIGLDPSYPNYDPAVHDPADFRGMWESNMSSPTTGDISNSNRSNTDLPVYNSTYVVYGQNFNRTQAEALHNHGHQLESILSHVNKLRDGNVNLFWRKFVGQDNDGQFITGRAGWTHMPPNTTTHYDYENPTSVLSDIEDWTPDNSGAQTLVNRDTWGDIAYAWPSPALMTQRTETQWYIYWWQNMPGRDNTIPYGSGTMSNWWVFTGDWDVAIEAGLGLHE